VPIWALRRWFFGVMHVDEMWHPAWAAVSKNSVFRAITNIAQYFPREPALAIDLN
jgi:hypothetical protein